jgi:hypothetical protein
MPLTRYVLSEDAANDLIDTAIAAAEDVLFPPWIAGRWYDITSLPGAGGTATANTSISANVLRAVPFYIPRDEAIDRIGFNVNVQATAGKLARLMAYEVGTDGNPGALIVDGGTVAIDATGDKEVTVSIAGPRWIYLAEFHDEAITIPSFTTSAGSPLGRATVAGTPGLCAFKALAFGAAPDPFPTSPGYAVTTLLLGGRAV